MSRPSLCMRCGAPVPGTDSVYLIAHDRTPSDAKRGFDKSKLFSATLCHECGRKFRYDFVRWLEVDDDR